jgi:hypothetical protein
MDVDKEAREKVGVNKVSPGPGHDLDPIPNI